MAAAALAAIPPEVLGDALRAAAAIAALAASLAGKGRGMPGLRYVPWVRLGIAAVAIVAMSAQMHACYASMPPAVQQGMAGVFVLLDPWFVAILMGLAAATFLALTEVASRLGGPSAVTLTFVTGLGGRVFPGLGVVAQGRFNAADETPDELAKYPAEFHAPAHHHPPAPPLMATQLQVDERKPFI